MESTYGGVAHETEEQAAQRLAQIINDTIKAGGNIVIPSFVLERAQNVLYHLNKFLLSHQIPELLVFLDSPMAVDITSVFSHHPEYLNQSIRDMIAAGHSPFSFPELTQVTSAEQSKAINNIRGSTTIIAGSGMATGGRIKHHLVNNITRPESSIVFVGYQAENTLGRQIVDGAKEVRILGQNYPVRARIEKIDGFSAHADNGDLLKWLSAFKQPPKKLFLVHSEPAVTQQFARSVTEKFGWQPVIPEFKGEYVL
jgi:metallo-beta-lactamase family protein